MTSLLLLVLALVLVGLAVYASARPRVTTSSIVPADIAAKVDEIMARNKARYAGFVMELESPTALTHSQTLARMDEISAELERFADLTDTTPEQDQEFADLRDTYKALDLHRRQLERAADLAEIRSMATGVQGGSGTRRDDTRTVGGAAGGRGDYDRDAVLEPDSIEDARFRNPWDLTEVRTFGRSEEELATELQARATCAIERMQGTSDEIRQAAQSMLERADNPAAFARQVLTTSSPAYLRGWSKLAAGKGHTMTADEQRAMSLTDAAGGYLVPFQLDPSVIVTSNGSVNDIRKAARQVVATGDVWNGVSAPAVSWSWDAEGAEVSDDAPTFAQPSIPIHKAQGFVPISIEAFEDAANVTQEIGRLLAEGKDDLEAVAFTLGTGSGQPTGIVTALAGTSSEINAAADDTFAVADVRSLYNALPGKHRARASWLANNSIYTLIRAFDTAGGGGFWANLNGDRPEALLGKPVLEAEAMDGTITTTGAVSNFALVFGNFQNYVIADRVGTRVEFIQTLFHTGNNRPSGQRGWHAWYRVGADSVNDAAFRLLDVPSAA
ncbi:phage major capsid protein [Nocardioides sp.]|uniref:phage major capsid protein n=1 Tax=Nocardioides sp. TaxID=35761 RepID=UPI0035AE2D10